MLRRRTLLVVAIVLCSLLLLPLLNLTARTQAGEPVAWTAAAMFDTKFQAARWFNRSLYGWGISTSPAKVIVGRKGWLFLGDEYASTVTATRQGRTAQDDAKAVRIVAAAQAWDGWLQQRGVKAFRILVGPNKGSVYPEYLPRWAAPAPSAPVDALFAQASVVHVDARPALMRAKAQAGDLLYYATDTHWTALGGGVAFDALARALAPLEGGLRWPAPPLRALRAVQPRAGGDLANFLQLSDVLTDVEPVTELSGGGMPDAARGPARVVSPRALNARKVLWLRDSFGGAMAPLMAATFSEVVHVPLDVALRRHMLAPLVERWRPDYVVVTVVERNALSELFALPPPSAGPAATRP